MSCIKLYTVMSLPVTSPSKLIQNQTAAIATLPLTTYIPTMGRATHTYMQINVRTNTCMHQLHDWNGSTYHFCHSYHSTTYKPDQDPTPRSWANLSFLDSHTSTINSLTAKSQNCPLIVHYLTHMTASYIIKWIKVIIIIS